MGNRGSSLLQDEEIKIIAQETGFTRLEIERLYRRFISLDQSGICGSLSREDFLRVPELAINPLSERIVHMFFVDCDDDHDRINFRQFMKVLATFRSSTSTKTKQQNSNSNNNIFQYNQQQENESPSNKQQKHLLFDSIDPEPFKQNLSLAKHSRHSSFHHSSYNNTLEHLHHATTNQHSFRYAASSSHVGSTTIGYSHSQRSSQASRLSELNNNNNGKLVPVIDPSEPVNSRRNKLYFIFELYDVNNDGLIDIDDLVWVIKALCGSYVDEARVKRIAERSLKQADKNCDGFIDFEEFCLEFKHSPLD